MHLQFAELPVIDQDRAMTFHTEHLGCTVRADTPMGDDGGRRVELAFPGAETALAADLANLTDKQWATPSQCTELRNHHEDASHRGWNVTARGSARRVEDRATINKVLGNPNLQPWAGGVRSTAPEARPPHLLEGVRLSLRCTGRCRAHSRGRSPQRIRCRCSRTPEHPRSCCLPGR